MVVDGEGDLEGESGEVGRGGAEQAAKRGEAGGFELVEARVERLAGGESAGRGRQAGEFHLKRGKPGLGAAKGGEGAFPAGGDMYSYVSPVRLLSGAGGRPIPPGGHMYLYVSPVGLGRGDTYEYMSPGGGDASAGTRA